MSAMTVAQYEQDIQNTVTTPMDTTPIAQSQPADLSPPFLTTIPPTQLDSSLQNQLLQDSTAVFLNKADHPNTVAPMHVSMPDLSSSVFMSSMETVDPASHLHTSSPGFISEFATDPFAVVTPIENAMNQEVSTLSQSQIPSPSIHGSASSYSAGVTSSLESALDPVGVSGGRSRANTSVSPPSISSSTFSSLSPTTQQPMVISFPATDALSGKQEELPPPAEAHVILGEMLKDIAKTASSAEDACRMRDSFETTSKVDELKERISQVSKMIAMLSVSRPDSSYTNPPVVPHQIPMVPIPEQHPIGFTSLPASTPPDIASHLNVSDQSRKRCASELEERRTVKSLKREPQEDIPLTLPPTVEAPVTLPIETSPVFSTQEVPLPQSSGAPLSVLPQSQPSSRPPTPPVLFSANGPFSPVKMQTPILPPFPSFIPGAPIEFSTPVVAGSPTFPGLHTAWSDSVVPTSRHHHSLSTGSLNRPMQSLPQGLSMVQNQNIISTPFPSPPVQQIPPQSPSAISSISSPIGRMSRSGSITGPLFNNSFGYFMEPFPESTTNWPGINKIAEPGPPVPATSVPQPTPSTWYVGPGEASATSGSPSTASDSPSTRPSTNRNSPTDDEDEDDADHSDENEHKESKPSIRVSSGDGPTNSASGSDVPQEYREAVDRIFFEYLNKICSNLDATDSKGEHIHQTLMAKKMQRLDESPDFRPFKFRIQAFTLGFLEELARQGYPEEKIPMKKIRNYLWRQQYILRFNEDGKKAKSKGNHIWNIEAKKAGDGKWEFRPFHRKLAGTPPGVAYCGLKWSWTPRIWDPQASWQNVPVLYSSPNLPSWLSWKDDVLSGIPPPEAESCQITVVAKFHLDGHEGQLSHTFNLTIAPVSTIDATNFSRSRRPSLAGELPRRSTSDSALFQAPQRSKPRAVIESPNTRVIRVLQSVAQRVTEEAESQFVSVSPPKQAEIEDLVKQKHVLEQTVNAYDKEISGRGHSETRQLAVAAQNVVVQAAHSVIADRTAASGGVPVQQSETKAIQSVTVHELTDATQDAIAKAVKRNGTASTEVDIIVAATSILKARTPITENTPTTITSPSGCSQSSGTVPSRLNPNMPPGFTELSPLPEYV